MDTDPPEWPDDFLDQMRAVGDPDADAVVTRLAREHETNHANDLLRKLVHDTDAPSSSLPDYVLTYLEKTAPRFDAAHGAKLEAGQELFAEHGPEIGLLLATYSLPASYCAAKGVQVLWRTGKLYTNPRRRILETAQLIIDVMKPGGLTASGDGVRSAQRVRLMHAGVRHLLLQNVGPWDGRDLDAPAAPWDTNELGYPINQEDLAGTLGTFGYIVLDGLEKLDIDVTPAQRDSYIYAWSVVGKLMGLDPTLCPETFAEAKILSDTIRRRQIRPSQAGRELTKELLAMMDQLLGSHLLDGVAPSIMRRCIDDDGLCDEMGIPPADAIGDLVESAMSHLMRAVSRLEGSSTTIDGLARKLGMAFMQGMVTFERGGSRPPFSIPTSLETGWKDYAGPS